MLKSFQEGVRLRLAEQVGETFFNKGFTEKFYLFKNRFRIHIREEDCRVAERQVEEGGIPLGVASPAFVGRGCAFADHPEPCVFVAEHAFRDVAASLTEQTVLQRERAEEGDARYAALSDPVEDVLRAFVVRAESERKRQDIADVAGVFRNEAVREQMALFVVECREERADQSAFVTVRFFAEDSGDLVRAADRFNIICVQCDVRLVADLPSVMSTS